MKLPPGFKEAAVKDSGPWQPATPSEDLPRGEWWRDYKDPNLDALEAEIEAASPTLAAAAAQYDQARAFAAEASSYLLPFVTAGGSATRNRQSAERPLRSAHQPNQYGANTADLSVSFDFDFWGRIRNAAAAGRALAQASAGDLEGVRLELHTELANDYIALRGLDAEEKLLTDTVAAYARANQMTQDRYQGKIASGIDVSRSESQLDSARALASDVTSARALLEHAIASLVGKPASNFTLEPAIMDLKVPQIPLALPSTLLQRRPDIAAAERRVAAANAEIGVAKAAFYPDISLSLLGGFQDTGSVVGLISAPMSFWSVGPGVVAPIFEGGLLEAEESAAYGRFDEAGAHYRETVLGAFQEVEDNLALLNYLGQEVDEDSAAAKAAEHTAKLSLSLYKDGAVSYLDVVVAQAEALAADRAVLEVGTRRLQASVRLFRALGGGWSADKLPDETTASTLPERPAAPTTESQAVVSQANSAVALDKQP
jgi:NodT family efflux transporter outer membrane factor (OMF) lipoprotein